MLNALKFYERFVLIVLHALLSINRACAVFTPLKYSYIFNLRNTSLMVASAFIICLPVFIIYAFQIFGCLYFFDPYEYTFYYNYNLCFHVHRIVEWFFAGFIMGTSTVADVLIAISLLRQRKVRQSSSTSYLLKSLVRFATRLAQC
ncbi:hypothetical protein ANCCAN_01270 [Ancylostoma caninum]|uniref:G-protein coupled receptors family 1 profile domain-containing protein n=1 Tax=Ancylostoma caninum TaxID=29170 RepID=A0A368H7I6_ANCCA|nr:hypothetical protein ANCCAN_01270 [Ancylostoma caninum]